MPSGVEQAMKAAPTIVAGTTSRLIHIDAFKRQGYDSVRL
jgi:hypothetical protein